MENQIPERIARPAECKRATQKQQSGNNKSRRLYVHNDAQNEPKRDLEHKLQPKPATQVRIEYSDYRASSSRAYNTKYVYATVTQPRRDSSGKESEYEIIQYDEFDIHTPIIALNKRNVSNIVSKHCVIFEIKPLVLSVSNTITVAHFAFKLYILRARYVNFHIKAALELNRRLLALHYILLFVVLVGLRSQALAQFAFGKLVSEFAHLLGLLVERDGGQLIGQIA